MGVLTTVRVVAVVATGLLAGIFFGDRAGARYARAALSGSSFVQFQQVEHVHYVRFMPPLVVTGLVAGLAWLFMVRAEQASAEFGLIAAATCGIALIAILTRRVNVPINNELMTWSIAAPPTDLRERWAPWERVNTIRAVVAIAVLILEAVALSLRASHAPI